MSETRQSIKAKLQLMMNFAALAAEIGDSISDTLTETLNDDIFDTLDAIKCGEITADDNGLELLMSEMDENGYFENARLEEGEELHVPTLSIDDMMNLIMKIPVSGGQLILSRGQSDDMTEQACIMYQPEKSDYEIDIAFAEVKAGEIVTIHNKPADNKDIDLYVFSDPYSEDFTNKYEIKHDDIVHATTDTD